MKLLPTFAARGSQPVIKAVHRMEVYSVQS